MNFRIKEKFILRISGGKRRYFSTWEVDRNKRLAQCFKNWKSYISVLKKRKNKTKQNKKQSVWYFIYHGISFTGCYRALILNFWGWKIRSFLSQNFDGNMIFTDIWKVLVLKFSGMGNTIFFWDKKLMERWHLLITQKFLLWTFWWWEIRSFFSQKVDAKIIFT